MTALVTVYQGANALLSRPLFQADGITPLPAASLVVCECDLLQLGKVVRTLVKGTDSELRASGDGNGIELELTSAITAALKRGQVTERYRLGLADGTYTAEPGKSLKKLLVTQIVIA